MRIGRGNRIDVTDEIVEAGARAAYGVFVHNLTRPVSWDDLPEEEREEIRAESRACIIGALEAAG